MNLHNVKWNLKLITFSTSGIPVTDIKRSAKFYERFGFRNVMGTEFNFNVRNELIGNHDFMSQQGQHTACRYLYGYRQDKLKLMLRL